MELKEENVDGHLLRKQRITYFLRSRGLSEEKQLDLIKSYAKSIKSNERLFKIYKTICTSNITFRLFKKWIDKKIKHVKKETVA